MKFSCLPTALLLTTSTLCAAPITFTTSLSGASENPPNGSTGTGYATVVIDSAANTLRVIVEFYGLTGPNTAAHIHCCIAPPGNTGVATATPTFPGFPTGATGFYDQTFDTTLASSFRAGYITANGGTPASAQAALFAGIMAGQAYLNVHTAANPGGEIRGFLAPVPEPGTMAMVGLALGLVGLKRRFRRA